jgi:hypothetical protein
MASTRSIWPQARSIVRLRSRATATLGTVGDAAHEDEPVLERWAAPHDGHQVVVEAQSSADGAILTTALVPSRTSTVHDQGQD